MTRLAPAPLAAALTVSVGLHLAAISGLVQGTPVRQEGGAPAAVAALGSSFADLAAGSIPASAPAETVQPTGPIAETPVAEPVYSEAETTEAPEATEPTTSERTARAAAPASAEEPSEIGAATSVERPDAEAVRPPPFADAAAVPASEALVAMSTADPAAPIAARPAPAASPAPSATRTAHPAARSSVAPRAVAAAPVEAQRRVEAATALALETSLRPRPRPANLDPERPRRAEDARSETSAGNADRTARAGSDTGRNDAEAARAAPRPTDSAASSGNAAASNYPGLVMRQVSRVRRPDVSARGTARISFRVAATGALEGARVSRSSGSSALDRAAITVIRRAAPFPPPPAGAPRDFTVEIRGR